MGELGTHLATERAGVVTLHLRESAPQLYPDFKSIVFPADKHHRTKVNDSINFSLLFSWIYRYLTRNHALYALDSALGKD